MPKLSIIIPAFNEAPTIRRLVEKMIAVPFPVEFEVLIIDDHSQDQTFAITNTLGSDYPKNVRVFHNEVNRGKGYSIKRGFENASGDFAIVQDADMEYDPFDIPKLVEPLLKGEADAVFGSRFLTAAHPAGMALPNKVANQLLTFFTNLIFGTRLTDVYSCYKVIPLRLLKSFRLERDGFESEAEILSKLLSLKKRIGEVAIAYQGRTVKQGKKIKAADFFLALEVLWKYRSFKS